MTDPLCRLTVQHAGDDGTAAVDLMLPSTVCVGQLMPSLLDIVEPDAATATAGRRWRLSRVGGTSLDESLSLADNEVRDGDLLLLTTFDTPGPRWLEPDPTLALARSDESGHGSLMQTLPAVCCVSISTIVAAMLIWAHSTTAAPGHLVVGACLAAAAGSGAVVVSRVHPDPLLCVPLVLAAVMFAAAVGYVSVPTGPHSAHVLLASAAAFAVAVVLLRLTGCGTVCLTALAVVTGLTTAVSATGVMWQVSTSAQGASLATLALALLALAPRLAISMTRVGPSTPDLDDCDAPPVCPPARAELAHQLLTGVVTGASICSALGAAVVVVDHFRDGRPPLIAWGFTTVIGLAVALRARTHVHPTRRFALVVAGMATAMAGFVLVVVSAPEQAYWSSVLAAGLAAAALTGRTGVTVGPVVRRGADMIEYLALAAVMPMACWVGGLYDVVRGASVL